MKHHWREDSPIAVILAYEEVPARPVALYGQGEERGIEQGPRLEALTVSEHVGEVTHGLAPPLDVHRAQFTVEDQRFARTPSVYCSIGRDPSKPLPQRRDARHWIASCL